MNTQKKEIIFIGLGKMGMAMATHLVEAGYSVHAADANQSTYEEAKQAGITVYKSATDAITESDQSEKVVWIMVPARFVDDVITEIQPALKASDTIIDGGNSFFRDTIRRYDELQDVGIDFIDCGTSGGVTGARFGASLMVGGDTTIVKKHEEIFTTLAIEDGYGHVGSAGSGHFVKMVHNGIEYGMMGAIAEGMNVLHDHKEGLEIDVCAALKPYEHGSIIESRLMTWLSEAYHTQGKLESIAGEVPKGETEMEMEYLAQQEHLRILDAAITQRKLTRTEPSFVGTLISAMRNEFGGHAIINKGTSKKGE